MAGWGAGMRQRWAGVVRRWAGGLSDRLRTLGQRTSGFGTRLGAVPRRTRWWLGGAGAVALTALLAWALWPSPPAPAPVPRERQYIEFTACLLADRRGLSDASAGSVWAGLQETSLATRAKVQYLTIVGPQTPHNASLFATSLAQGGCRVIIAVGELAVSGVAEAAPAFPLVQFYLVGGELALPNVSHVDAQGDTQLHAEVNRIVRQEIWNATRHQFLPLP